ncbi:hypothetical protein K493DRAFT_309590 [Basidiobolus meristosporus CBS 931.73]|uniref:Uncharacterized protein n=1 Tax=Basidiobolus meristosporus CBS 931.73 TaxID=1314790 RepID=A0A1Y1VSR1_9FUNG|nr:hypothetical protein K493DRAFT_309590 [Basidiobolus meristosporus CBS 931.73]|eukprot:ORX64342.1 hypothetical protein K493DRAFT_309590 [Basidiobolus meristosporus CBS 931.73]
MLEHNGERIHYDKVTDIKIALNLVDKSAPSFSSRLEVVTHSDSLKDSSCNAQLTGFNSKLKAWLPYGMVWQRWSSDATRVLVYFVLAALSANRNAGAFLEGMEASKVKLYQLCLLADLHRLQPDLQIIEEICSVKALPHPPNTSRRIKAAESLVDNVTYVFCAIGCPFNNNTKEEITQIGQTSERICPSSTSKAIGMILTKNAMQ